MNESAQPTDRVIRVFISSTFLDMQEERDILIKKIFPQLRKLCEERAVTWTEVDLRWGITDEQKAEGKVLPLCLEEIQRCRPYFIGLLGERYGSLPSEIPPDLIERQPWLEQHRDKSITALEIIHGVLRDQQMHGHAYFYFRDPRFVESVPAVKRQNFIADNPGSAEKLTGMKNEIRRARAELVCELRENYATPEKLGEWILEDFTKLIDRLYPKDQTPDPLDQEAARHEAYARSRRLAFVGREDLLRQLDEHCAEPSEPLVLTGESGCGKSALLAEWVARWRNDHPEDLVIQHYVGSTPDSADWQRLVRRILGELKREFHIAEDLPATPDALRNALNEWTTKSAGPRCVVLVMDALNQLAEDGSAKHLGWLPVIFPTNFRLLVSTLPGASLDALRKRGWSELNVPLFARADIAPAALAYFKIFSKTPPSDIVATIEATPAACNALYLRAVLDELRQFGKHEDLKAKAGDYLSAPGPKELYERILERWEQDFGADFVRQSLSLIWAARRGLSEAELLDLLGKNGQPLPRAHWTPLYLAAESSLAQCSGLLKFFHDYLRKAVRDRLLPTADLRESKHTRLAEYFDAQKNLTRRKLDELPWQLSRAAAWTKLRDCLTDMTIFQRLIDHDEHELWAYWLSIGNRFDISEAYWEALERWEKVHPRDPMIVVMLNNVGRFIHQVVGRLESAESFIRKALQMWDNAEGIEKPDFSPALLNLGAICEAEGKYLEAETLFRKALTIFEGLYGRDAMQLVGPLNNLAGVLAQKGDHGTAEMLQLRALTILRKNPDGANQRLLATILHNVADRMECVGDLSHAEPMCREALDVRKQFLGANHPDVAQTLCLLAVIARRLGNQAEAERLHCEALEIEESARGPFHPKVAIRLNNVALLLKARGDFSGAEQLLRRAVAIGKQAFNSPNPDLATWLNNLAGVFVARGQKAEAVPLLREALEILDAVLGTEHNNTYMVLDSLADILLSLGRREEAFPFLQRVVGIHVQRLGMHHVKSFTGMANLGILFIERGMPDEAAKLLDRSLSAHVEVLGKNHPQTIALANFFRNVIPVRKGDGSF